MPVKSWLVFEEFTGVQIVWIGEQLEGNSEMGPSSGVLQTGIELEDKPEYWPWRKENPGAKTNLPGVTEREMEGAPVSGTDCLPDQGRSRRLYTKVLSPS